MKFEFKTKPFQHQQDEFEEHKDTENRAIFWEQGCGKSKITIDTVAYQFCEGHVNGLLVIAPNGVHRNWVTDELPAHLPENIAENARYCIYQSSRASTKKHQSEWIDLLNTPADQLAVLAITYDGIMTKKGAALAKKFLTSRRVFYVADEAARIKTPGAKRTVRVLASSKYAVRRRILTGTPIANSPFDIYSQMRFLFPDYWKPYGLASFSSFKTTYGVWVTQRTKDDKEYQQCVAYNRLDDLKNIIAQDSSRVTKDEVLDLPPKLYSKRYMEMTREQKRLYAAFKDEFMAELDSGELLTAPLAIVRLLRFQQIICGYLPQQDGGPLLELPGKNPRLEILKEICEDLPHKAIIWCRFTRDIDNIMQILGDKAVRYDGSTSDEARAEAKEAFQNGEKQFFVANPQAAGEGLTLHAAKTVVYYSNSFKLTERLQSEDRAHRIGQDQAVNYIDIVAPETVDEKIVEALVSKKDIAQLLLGDKIKEWI